MPLPKSLQPVFFVIVFALLCSSVSAAGDKGDVTCPKNPELIRSPNPSKEEQRVRKLRAQGMFAISISEDGDVVDAKVIRPSSPEAVEPLLALAKSMKFKARPGCGISKIMVNYSLAGQ